VETAFFQKWWDEQSFGTQQLVRQLAASGRLEFVSGGWCMNDEATVNFVDVIQQVRRTRRLFWLTACFGQMSLGHRWLYEHVGVRPRVAWQIDPFGHSASYANLAAQMVCLCYLRMC
jgi:hypothetical protein